MSTTPASPVPDFARAPLGALLPTTLNQPVGKLSRSAIYNEFRYFHTLAGSKANVSKGGLNAADFDRYMALEDELLCRRKLDALWEKMHSDHSGYSLEQRAHFKIGQIPRGKGACCV